MHRRMKIKATPNLFGGSKKSNINTSGNKSQVNAQKASNEDKKEDICLKENGPDVQISIGLLNEKYDRSTLNMIEPKKESVNNVAASQISTSPLQQCSIKNEAEISDRSTNLLPLKSVKYERETGNSLKIGNTNIIADKNVPNIPTETGVLQSSNNYFTSRVSKDRDSSDVASIIQTLKKEQSTAIETVSKAVTENESESVPSESQLGKLSNLKIGQNIGTHKEKLLERSVQKSAGRRARFKGQPFIHTSNKRHLVELESSDKNLSAGDKHVPNFGKVNSCVETLEKPIKDAEKEIGDAGKLNINKGTNISLTDSNQEIKNRVEAKENIDRTKLKELNHHKKAKLISGSSIKSDFLSNERKAFYERKLKFKKKLSTGNLERRDMTMFDLIFWNPVTNPMPSAHQENGKAQRSATANENASTTTVAEEELQTEEEGLLNGSTSNTKSTMENAEDTVDTKPSSISDSFSNVNEEVDDADEEISTLAPQVKIGPNGELIIDEKSLTLQTTAAKNRDEVLKRTEVIEEANESSHYGKWSKRRKRSTEWTRKETSRFYKALSTVGTDFSLMETLFPWRARSELKIKFKKEERIHRHLIDTALNDCTQFDFSIFDESDYDPEQDRKETKEAEKAEAKKKRDIEREERKREKKDKREQARMDKIRKKKLKREQARLDKIRNKKLKTIYKNKRKKKKALAKLKSKSSRVKRRKAANVKIETEEVICEVVFSSAEIIQERNFTRKEGEETESKIQEESVSESKANPAVAESLSKSPSHLDAESEANYPSQAMDCHEEHSAEPLATIDPQLPIDSLPQCKYSELDDELLTVRPEKRLKVYERRKETTISETSKFNSQNECVSSSYFKVENASPVIPPSSKCSTSDASLNVMQSAVEVGADQISEVLRLPPFLQSSDNEQPISISTIPVSIDPELYAVVTDGKENAKNIWAPNEEETQALAPSDINLESPPSECTGPNHYDYTSVTNQGSTFVGSPLAVSTTQDMTQINIPSIRQQPSNVIVMAAPDPNNPSGQIYHMYEVARINPETPSVGPALPVSQVLTDPNAGFLDKTPANFYPILPVCQNLP